jgi:hypothetical protein
MFDGCSIVNLVEIPSGLSAGQVNVVASLHRPTEGGRVVGMALVRFPDVLRCDWNGVFLELGLCLILDAHFEAQADGELRTYKGF